MNPGEGLKVNRLIVQRIDRAEKQVRAFKGAGTQVGVSDTELAKLAPYVRLPLHHLGNADLAAAPPGRKGARFHRGPAPCE